MTAPDIREPALAELWEEARGNPERYRALMRQHGHIEDGSPYCATCGHHQRDHHYSVVDDHGWCRLDCDCEIWKAEAPR